MLKCARLLIICLFMLALPSCGGDLSDMSETTAPETAEEAAPAIDLDGFTLVRAELADAETVDAAADLYAQIKAAGGEVKLTDDFIPRGTEPDSGKKEILFGLTNRPESAEALAALPGYYDYSVTLVGNKLCMTANTPALLGEAMTYFLGNLSRDGEILRYVGGNYLHGGDYPLRTAQICGVPLADYVIVYPADGTREAAAAEQMALWIAEQTGHLARVTDDRAAEQTYEILLGKTNRAASLDPAVLANKHYGIKISKNKLALASASAVGYNAIKDRMVTLMKENKLNGTFSEEAEYAGGSLDGARVMFVGNSFTYYGGCTAVKNEIVSHDKGYFYQAALAMGDEVNVTAVTYGGAVLRGSNKAKSLYDILVDSHPNHYGSGKELDPFYAQDYVILQQAGENPSNNEESTRAIMALFPPETKFCFFVHHHNVWRNHNHIIRTAQVLRDEGSAIYLPAGHLIYDVWTGKTAVPGAKLVYNQDSFCVNQENDRYHPNYLNGYLTALTVYYAITGRSIAECPYDFVKKSTQYYTNGATSNYTEILASNADMQGLKMLVEQYVNEYN